MEKGCRSGSQNQSWSERRISIALQNEEDLNLLPRRWHLYIVDLAPRIGTKPGKQRPCLAIQPSEFSEAGLESTVVLPLTTKVSQEDAFPLRVRIPKGTAGLERDSDLLVDQVLAWDNSLFHKELGLLPDALIERVTAALKDFFDI
jgi:mRNA interferase MazF